MLRVFLSFQSPDRTIALSLKRAIEAALPGAEVFVDQTHLRYGHLWQPSLFDAIAKAQAFLILVSHRAGDWQKFEYYEALDRRVKNDAFVLLPVIIADRAKGPAANLPGLAQMHWIESTEPTAPDPLAKIVAALQVREVAKPPNSGASSTPIAASPRWRSRTPISSSAATTRPPMSSRRSLTLPVGSLRYWETPVSASRAWCRRA